MNSREPRCVGHRGRRLLPASCTYDLGVDAELLLRSRGLLGGLPGASATLAFRLSEHGTGRHAGPGAPAAAPARGLRGARDPGVVDLVLDGDPPCPGDPAAYLLVSSARTGSSDDLLEMARQVRRDGEIREADMELPWGPLFTQRL